MPPSTYISTEGMEAYRAGYDAGYRHGLSVARRDIGADFGEVSATKKVTKRRKKDPKMARALEEANRKGRTSNGKLRKGWNQSRIMTLAHKLKKGM